MATRWQIQELKDYGREGKHWIRAMPALQDGLPLLDDLGPMTEEQATARAVELQAATGVPHRAAEEPHYTEREIYAHYRRAGRRGR